MPTFAPGTDIAWRCRIRAFDRRDGVSFVSAMRVIEDTPDEIVAVRRVGDAVRRRVIEGRLPEGHRHRLVVG